MLENVITTAMLGLTGAALIVPATRQLLLGDPGLKDWLGGELEFDRILEDMRTVRMKNGHAFRVFNLKGQSYDTKPVQEQENLLANRADALHQIGQTGCSLRFFGIKRQEDVSFDADWPCKPLKEIGKAEQATFKSGYDVYWYLLLEGKDLASLDKASNKAQTIFADYDIRSVRREEDRLAGCPLTGFINYLVSGELRFDLPAVSEGISGNIPASDLIFETDGTLHTQTPTSHFVKSLTVTAWPEMVKGTLVSDIIAVPGDIEICQICNPLNNEMVITGMLRKSNELSTGIIGNAEHAAEHSSVATLVGNGEGTLFKSQFQILVRAKSIGELEDLIEQIGEIISRARVTYSVETKGAPYCWFNRIPGRGGKLIRPNRLMDKNIAALWPLQYSPKGLRSSPFGKQPIRLFKTLSGQSYSFQFHAADKPQSPGNYIIFAPTGGGKSTLVMHLLGGLAKFADVRSYVFDSKEGALAMVKKFGGIYQSFDTLALNPLDKPNSNKSSRHQMALMMRAMLGNQYATDMDEEIDHAIDVALGVETPHRTFNNIFEYAFAKDSEIRKAFGKWVTDDKGKQGLYSHVFNAGHDTLSAHLQKSHLVGINMNEALEDPVLGAPVIAHISNAIAEAAKANKGSFSIFVDEAANLLQNKGFRDVVLQMYREYRKLNGIVGLAFQDPAALARFPDHQGIINNTQTLMFLPNSLVKREDLEPFNLNEEQIQFITGTGHHVAGRPVLIVKRDMTTGYNESTILNVDLGFLEEGLRHYQAGTDANREVISAEEKWGEAWLQYI